ncbi:MAG: hypothetical protein KKA67_14300 [Spirochaetes bacterium]|nr:hypothetical protein [Spirochaetota bacterium]MBU1081751.1 hypothetical protein [Spirochaetota bacterium]
MPIKPIDLQTLFLQLGQVGKQQAAEKDGALLHANLHGAAAKRIEDEAAKAVHRPEDAQTATESVKDDGGKPPGYQGDEKKRDDGKAPEDDVETISDPALGGNVDISG